MLMVELQLALFWPITVVCVVQAIRLWIISRENARRGREAVRMQRDCYIPGMMNYWMEQNMKQPTPPQ